MHNLEARINWYKQTYIPKPLNEQLVDKLKEYEQEIQELIHIASNCYHACLPIIHPEYSFCFSFADSFNDDALILPLGETRLLFYSDGRIIQSNHVAYSLRSESFPDDILLLSKFIETFPAFKKDYLDSIRQKLDNPPTHQEYLLKRLVSIVKQTGPSLTKKDTLILQMNENESLSLVCLRNNTESITIMKDIGSLSDFDLKDLLETLENLDVSHNLPMSEKSQFLTF